MLNFVWAGLIIISVVFAFISGNISELSQAIFSGIESGVTLLLTISGMICFWSGINSIANKTKINMLFSKIIYPITRLIFPSLDKNSEAMKNISMNITANMFGLGSAATPIGLKAMKELKKISPLKDCASDEMIVFVVINTASVQILPTTLAMLRAKYGAGSPFDILPAVWIASICSVLSGVIFAKVLMKYVR